MADMKYTIWSTNRFNEDILQDIVAYFNNLELAHEFVEYQAQKGQSYLITDCNGNLISYDWNDMNKEEFEKMLEELENDPELKDIRIPDEWDALFRKTIEETIKRSYSDNPEED